jgi:hypothetical protein
MSTTTPAVGLDHPTTVPTNFERDEERADTEESDEETGP